MGARLPMPLMPGSIGCRKKIEIGLITALLIITGGLNLSCGKKGALFLPEARRPAAVNDLAASVFEGGITLSWSRPTVYTSGARFRDLKSYHLLRAEGSGGFREITEISTEARKLLSKNESFLDENTTPGVTYRYKVRSESSLKVLSADSNVVEVARGPVLPAPGGLKGEAVDGRAMITWKPVPGAAGYVVYRSEGKGDGKSLPVGRIAGTEPSYAEAVSITSRYSYKVRALGSDGGEGYLSNPLNITPRRSSPPPPVGDLKAVVNGYRIYLSWPLPDEGMGVGGYKVCRTVREGGTAECQVTLKPFFMDDQAVPGVRYFYTVTVLDDTPEPAESEPASVELRVEPVE